MKIKSFLIQLVFWAVFLLPNSYSVAYNQLVNSNRLTFQDEYRINGYKKGFNGWEKVPLKIRVTQPSFGKEKIEVIAYQTAYGWIEVSFCLMSSVSKYTDGEDAAANFEYKASCGVMVFYFNF